MEKPRETVMESQMKEAMKPRRKECIDVLQALSLRDLVTQINTRNSKTSSKILREDIVDILKDEGTYFLLYYK